MNDVEKLSFEEAFGALVAIVQSLEEGDLKLDEALALYEQGMRLAQRCSDALDTAELQVQQLATAQNGQQMGMFLEDSGG
jgi:exodeoxyribonuclease VII small subunit